MSPGELRLAAGNHLTARAQGYASYRRQWPSSMASSRPVCVAHSRTVRSTRRWRATPVGRQGRSADPTQVTFAT